MFIDLFTFIYSIQYMYEDAYMLLQRRPHDLTEIYTVDMTT